MTAHASVRRRPAAFLRFTAAGWRFAAPIRPRI